MRFVFNDIEKQQEGVSNPGQGSATARTAGWTVFTLDERVACSERNSAASDLPSSDLAMHAPSRRLTVPPEEHSSDGQAEDSPADERARIFAFLTSA